MSGAVTCSAQMYGAQMLVLKSRVTTKSTSELQVLIRTFSIVSQTDIKTLNSFLFFYVLMHIYVNVV
jgi:hypothetical protein